VQARETGRSPARLVVRLFGSLAIEDGDRALGPGDLGGVRPKQVLEILLAARGHRVSTERLGELLWGAARPQDAVAAVQTFVSVLRRRLVDDRVRARALVVTEAEAYRFANDLIEFDLDRFDELVERSAREPTHAARRSLEQALGLVRGEVLEDEPYALWAQDLRNTYRGRLLGARLEAADAALAEHDYGEALAHAQAAASLDDFSERAYRLQMLALYALGRQHEALEVYRGFRSRLDDELGLAPTAEVRALETAILRQEDVHALLPRPLVVDRVQPRAGSVRLLGRAEELGVLVGHVRQALAGSFRLLVVEGEAGLGKTRLLEELAEALPGVRVGRARCSELERHLPYVPLAAALRDALGGLEFEQRCLPALRRVLPELALDDPAPLFSEVEALEALVELVSQQAPLVLLLDDLHWADASTLAALSYLQHRCDSVPAAVVVAIRTEETPPDHLVRSLRADARVRLEPLTARELAPLGIANLHASTGGNPRFVAETVTRSSEPPLAAALAEALVAQCRAEGAFAYRVLVTASVLEQPFDPELLAMLVRAEVTDLVEELERLCERRILRVEGPRFRFRYALVRDVLARTLSPARRRIIEIQRETVDDELVRSARSFDERLVIDGR
jgi:DNA-binding SARP family transcriptional activator